MITKALLQIYNNKFSIEERALFDTLTERGIPVESFSPKKMFRKQLDFDKNTLITGTIGTVLNALKQLGIEDVVDDTYPESIREYLKRDIYESTVGEMTDKIFNQEIGSVFVKPKDKMKRFTGKVIDDPSELYFLYGASRKLKVWVSNVVDISKECRVYVCNGQVSGMYFYDNDDLVEEYISINFIYEVISKYLKSDGCFKNFGMDFGILDDNQSVLIEMNRAFSLGNYGLRPDKYTDLIIAGWEELVSCLI